jgi:hypothetical protein
MITVPQIASAVWKICQADPLLNLVEIAEPLPGWQHIVIDRVLNEGTGRAAIYITVMPTGWTQVLDSLAGTCGLFSSFDAIGYLRGDEACISRGHIITY